MAREKGGNYLAFTGRLPNEQREFGQKICTEEAYRALFSGADGYPLIGESSPHYLGSEQACAKIHEIRPDARLVAVLRNPVDAIYARYLMRRRSGSINCELQAVLDEEEIFRDKGQGKSRLHLSTAFYGRHLKNYFEIFSREQIKVILFEDLISDTHSVLSDLFSFLGVDPDFKPDDLRHYNRSGVATSRLVEIIMHNRRALQPFVKRIMPRRFRGYLMDRLYDTLERPALTQVERLRLVSVYQEDIEQLEMLIERDLSHWKSKG